MKLHILILLSHREQRGINKLALFHIFYCWTFSLKYNPLMIIGINSILLVFALCHWSSKFINYSLFVLSYKKLQNYLLKKLESIIIPSITFFRFDPTIKTLFITEWFGIEGDRKMLTHFIPLHAKKHRKSFLSYIIYKLITLNLNFTILLLHYTERQLRKSWRFDLVLQY